MNATMTVDTTIRSIGNPSHERVLRVIYTPDNRFVINDDGAESDRRFQQYKQGLFFYWASQAAARLGIIIDSELENNLKKMEKIAALKPGWNGNGATGFSRRHIEIIRNLLFKIVVQPEIFPTAADSIQLEYEGENGSYLEFQIYEEGDVEVFCIDRNGSEKEWMIPLKTNEINGVINSFYE